jgi:hypothetical protein
MENDCPYKLEFLFRTDVESGWRTRKGLCSGFHVFGTATISIVEKLF